MHRYYHSAAFVWLILTAMALLPERVGAVIISSSRTAATRGLGHNPADPWKGVGMVGRLDGNDNANYFCTGTLILPAPGQPQTKKWVLTAAHCTYDNAFDINPGVPHPGGHIPDYPPYPLPDQYPYPYPRNPSAPAPNDPFLGAYADNKMLFHLPLEAGIANQHYQSTKVYRHPNYVAGDSTYDVALIELDQEVPSTAWAINRGQIADERAQNNSGLIGHIAGYGAGGDAFAGEKLVYGTKREGVNMVDAFGGVNNQLLLFDFDDHVAGGNGPLGGPAVGNCPNVMNPPFPVIDQCEANTTHGDSGGPMFMYDVPNNAWRVVGTTRGGDAMGFGQGGVGYGETANDVRIQSVAGWIDMTTPEPGTVGLMLIGILTLAGRRRARNSV